MKLSVATKLELNTTGLYRGFEVHTQILGMHPGCWSFRASLSHHTRQAHPTTLSCLTGG